ncbi:hypothetical protein [Streptomyces sp. NBC_01320]|uniref:hypothetical protein n=1 Tax=Streptomyces sp. NBC_01320 TaxID=2903824 RepID=UPI002E0E0D2A|nr:hypothetical protein OG395_55960 [Streptomyces sp. NBC_01320]
MDLIHRESFQLQPGRSSLLEHTLERHAQRAGICVQLAPAEARWRLAGTAKTYAQNFKQLEAYARDHGVHPFRVRFLLADAFTLHLT